MGYRSPPVEVVLGVNRQVNPDVLAAVRRRRTACPRARNHQARACCQTASERFVHPFVRRVTEPEVVAIDNEETRFFRVAQALGECSHRAESSSAEQQISSGAVDRSVGAAIRPQFSQAASAGLRSVFARARRASARPFRATLRVLSSSCQGRGAPEERRPGRFSVVFCSSHGRRACCSIP
jgi:hypothetical protein